MGCLKLIYQEGTGEVDENLSFPVWSIYTKKGGSSEKRSNYYPYGMLQPGRNYSSENYRYGFQGQERDDEIKGEGNSVNYTFRMHDPRLGRFFAVDPLASKHPHYSPYQFSGNKVVRFIELEGLEEYDSFEAYQTSGGTSESIDSWDGCDGKWLKSDRTSGSDRYNTAMGAITENNWQGRFEPFEQIRDYYEWVNVEVAAKGHEIKWVKGALHLVRNLAWLYDESGSDIITGLSLFSGPITAANVQAEINRVKPMMKDLNLAIANFAISKFSELLYGKNSGTSLTGDEAYKWDKAFIYWEQGPVAAPVYKKYSTKLAIHTMNDMFNYGGSIPGMPSIPVPSGVDLTDGSASNIYGAFGSNARIDVPMMMLWPQKHFNMIQNSEFKKQLYYSKGGVNYATGLYQNYQSVSKTISGY